MKRSVPLALTTLGATFLLSCSSPSPAPADGPIVVPVCNQLPRPPAAMVTVETGVAPTLTGGDIVPGVYTMTTLQYYPPADTTVTPMTAEYGQIWQFQGDRADLAERTGDITATASATYVVTSPMFLLTGTCNGDGVQQVTYDATPTQLRFSSTDQGVVAVQTLVLGPPSGG